MDFCKEKKYAHANKETEANGVQKRRWDLAPIEAIEAVVDVFGYGAERYGTRNWEKGIPFLSAFAALIRHVMAWRSGKDINPESGLPHLAHAAWYCLALMTYGETHPELDDRKGPLRNYYDEK